MTSITDSAREMNRVILEVDNKVCLSNDNSNDISSAMEELSASMESSYKRLFQALQTICRK